jgi:pimeloyl-ACP methyl ester carboxylesterase
MDIYAGPQQQVRINRRRRLNVFVTGEGAPTVVLSAGGGGSTLNWGRVQAELASTNRVVSFDRAGMGFSDPGPMPRTTGRAVDDLRAALAALDIGPPYVLVGHSMGSFDVRLFAFLYPDEVAGMVLVDPRGDDLAGGLKASSATLSAAYSTNMAELRRNAALAATKPKPGTKDYEVLVPPDNPQLTPGVNAAFRDALLRPSFWRTVASEGACLDGASARELAEAKRQLAAMPLIVLTASVPPFPCPPEDSRAVMAMWKSSHDALAALSERGVRRDVPDVGHMIPSENPGAVVAAIREVCAAAAPPTA